MSKVVPLRVLVVEDDPGDAMLVTDAFEAAGAFQHITHVEDGAQALQYLQDPSLPRPDLILLDLNLPGVSGHEVLANVKHDERLSAIPIVVFSTSSSPDDILHCYHSYANAYISKPHDLDGYDSVIATLHDFFARIAQRVPSAAAA
jgi:CheY-like chemotaxis protein